MLIYNDWQNYIIKFREHDALDNRLPLSENDAVMMAADIGRRLARESQWAFCPYTFPKDMWARDCQVEKKMILPFISAEQIGSGAFSTVEKVSISPSQQNFRYEEPGLVKAVRKKLNAKGNIQDFEREVRCLRLLNQLRHPNIIPLWGAYTYQEENNFLFPYIDMDLGKFLLSPERHQDFQWDVTFYSALSGLASALSKTHSLRLDQANHDVDFEAIGYHHDLRPPNVLVCADTFILADFGMGGLKGTDELSHTPYKPISGDYIAPECTDSQERPQIINRKIDVWAFGCLMAEVITFILKGTDGVQEFRSRRLTPGRFPQWKDASFYQPHGAVKQEVIDWMEALRLEHPHQDHLQLIKISFDALDPDPQSRPDISTVYQRLADVSMQKHLQSVQDMFREVQGAEPVSTPHTQHHLESLRFAWKRFEVWSNVLASGENHVSTQTFELSENSVGIMKKLLYALREELQKRVSRDSSGLASVSRQIVYEVENLWATLPNSLLQLAKKQWVDDPVYRKLGEQISGLCPVTHHDVPVARSVLPANTLRSEFEEAARSFKDGLPGSMPFSGISEIISIEKVYDITDKIQADQHRCGGGLRNLPKLRPYLVRLEGYVEAIDSTVQGNSEVLAVLWGPIAFLLQLAVTLDEAYDSLVVAVAELGRVLPDFKAQVSTPNNDIETMEVMVLFFKDILNFYRELMQPFTHQSKTVLSSAIVNYLRCLDGAKTAFAFLTYQEVKTSALSTIHSLIFQLAARNEDLMAIVCESMCERLTSDLSIAGDLLISLVHYAGPVYLVVDGVDEISRMERGRLVTELIRLTKTSERLRIIFSTRPEADITRLLEDTAVIINVHDENEGNIKNYIGQRTEYIFKIRGVYPRAQVVIKQLLEPVVDRAKGMFLYARLIMDMVATLNDLSEIQRELTVLPESLDDA
ncbi:nacht domain-containing protein [Xylaria palmicola]|nr:nacht domain-containing protein [Xylaria palmicola]